MNLRKIKLIYYLFKTGFSIGYMRDVCGIDLTESERKALCKIIFFLTPSNPINNEYFIEDFRRKMLTI